jgi:hypothetical protein
MHVQFLRECLSCYMDCSGNEGLVFLETTPQLLSGWMRCRALEHLNTKRNNAFLKSLILNRYTAGLISELEL